MAEKQPVSASLDDSFFAVFILRERELSRINEIVRDFLLSNADVSFYFICSDSITREYDAVAGARAYDNHKERRIEAVWISGSSQDFKRSVSIRLANRRPSNVSIALRGPGITVANAEKKIEEWLDGVRPWYAKLASTTFYLLLLVLVGILPLIAFLGWTALSGRWPTEPFQFRPSMVLWGFLGCTTGFGSSFVLNAFQSRLFPVGVFAVGHGVERERRTSAWRSIILAVIGLGLIVGFAGSLIASFAFQAMN